MRYPSLNKLPQQAISVPSLSGGLNLADSLHLVNDNQLTDVKNMWFKNSILQTRPAISLESDLGSVVADRTTQHENHIFDLEQTVDGEKCVLCIHKTVDDVTQKTDYQISKVVKGKIEFNLNAHIDDYVEKECFFTAKPLNKYTNYDTSLYTKIEGTGIYMLTSIPKHWDVTSENQEYITKKTNELFEICKFIDTNGNIVYSLYRFGYQDYYMPVIYINGKGDKYSTLAASEDTEYAPPSFVEGYSMFHNAGNKFYFTTDGVSKSFTLPINPSGYLIEARYTSATSGKKFYSRPRFITVEKGEKQTDVIKLYNTKLKSESDGEPIFYGDIDVNGTITFRKGGGGSVEVMPSGLNGFENNLEIIIRYCPPNHEGVDNFAPYKDIINNYPDSKLYGVTIAKWFGGTNKGTRLFLSGADGEHQNIVMWSKVNDPSYISENNYAYIGTSSQQITALHKQSDMLVVFKESELFYTEYTGQQEITASQVVYGSIIDIEANSSIFPFYQIHNEIGCNIPSSIQLCGNRLVWANKNKKVYMLKSANQYSNANVFELSQTIERRLRTLTDEEIKLCKSCVYDGYYILSFDNKSFVLNIENYYYKNTSAYADSRQQNRKFEWSYWEYPQSNGLDKTFYLVDINGCYIINFYVGYDMDGDAHCYSFSYLLTDNKSEDFCHSITGAMMSMRNISIESMLQTKLFDFGLPDRYKKIEQVYVGFGEIAGTTKISYITDSGTKEAGTIEFIGESNDYSPEYIKTKRLLPCINRANKFGIKFDCKGRIALSDLIIKYKFIGGVR